MTKTVFVVQTGPETYLGGGAQRPTYKDYAVPFEKARIFGSKGAAKQALQRIAWNRGAPSSAPRVAEWHIVTCVVQCQDAFTHMGDIIQREADNQYVQELHAFGPAVFCRAPASALVVLVGNYRLTPGFRLLPVYKNASGAVYYGAWGLSAAKVLEET